MERDEAVRRLAEAAEEYEAAATYLLDLMKQGRNTDTAEDLFAGAACDLAAARRAIAGVCSPRRRVVEAAMRFRDAQVALGASLLATDRHAVDPRDLRRNAQEAHDDLMAACAALAAPADEVGR